MPPTKRRLHKISPGVRVVAWLNDNGEQEGVGSPALLLAVSIKTNEVFYFG